MKVSHSLVAALPLLACAFVTCALVACGARRAPPGTPSSSKPPPSKPTTVTAFAVAPDNLRVDKVGMRDGNIRSDGSLDLSFTATIDGAADGIFIYSVNEKGRPIYGLRSDTIAKNEEVPSELADVTDTGNMPFAIGVVEDNKFVNEDDGTIALEETTHQLKLYVPNSANLKAGDHLRLWVRMPGGAVAGSAVIEY